MVSVNIEMAVKRHSEKVAVIGIRGDVTAACQQVLGQAWDEASVAPTKVVVLDFTDLSYMNSSGIGMLVTVLVRANRAKQKLMAFGLTDHYRQIFTLTRLDEAIGIHPDESAALAAAGAL
ncbi:STAS domain-containing protein [uncultured Jatrophihabitans sp.]|uniref:STAS domain-containing protein n=1 Tax=uncultured Jatrophihabitans sp. TaxID=1610747 RepID=UPI0035CB1C58